MKKITIKYWNTLSLGSRERALRACFPNNPATVKMMANEKPNLKSGFWKIAFSMIKQTDKGSHYKTVVNNTYYA